MQRFSTNHTATPQKSFWAEVSPAVPCGLIQGPLRARSWEQQHPPELRGLFAPFCPVLWPLKEALWIPSSEGLLQTQDGCGLPRALLLSFAGWSPDTNPPVQDLGEAGSYTKSVAGERKRENWGWGQGSVESQLLGHGSASIWNTLSQICPSNDHAAVVTFLKSFNTVSFAPIVTEMELVAAIHPDAKCHHHTFKLCGSDLLQGQIKF